MIEQKGQLYFDPSLTGLSKSLVEKMIDSEKESWRYNIALDYYMALIKENKTISPLDFQWLKLEFTIPYFADIVFRYKENVYGILFTSFVDDVSFSTTLDLDFFINKCKENNIIPALLPFKDKEIINISESNWCLISAEELLFKQQIKSINPVLDSKGEFKSQGKWEELNNAVMAYVQDLLKQSITQCLYHSYPNCDPNICWIDNEGVFNWMIIRTIKEGEKYPKKCDETIERLKRINGKGHYANVVLSEPNTKGILPRGEKVDIKFEIDDI